MSLIENIKDGIEVIQKSDNIDLIKQMMAIQTDAWTMSEENRVLKEENNILKDKFKIKEKLIFKDNAYWMEEGDKSSEPFCSGCWDGSQNAVHLHLCGNPAFATCPSCKVKVQIDPNYKERILTIPKIKSKWDSY
jgi:hypothetical protein